MPDSNNPNAANSFSSGTAVSGMPNGQSGPQNPNNPNADAFDKYQYLSATDPKGSMLGAQVDAGRQGVSDGSWVPFQNYSQVGGSGIYQTSALGAAQSHGIDVQNGATPGQDPKVNANGPIFPANTNAPTPISGQGAGVNGYGFPDTTTSGSSSSGTPVGSNGTVGVGGSGNLMASPLAPGPGPGGFYGTALSRYLTGK